MTCRLCMPWPLPIFLRIHRTRSTDCSMLLEQQAHDIVNGKTPDQIKQLPFGEWELVLSAGSPEDQDKVWSVIKGVPLQMEGNVIEATSPTELHIAGSEDDIEQKRPDITLIMTGPIPPRLMPKAGDVFDFQGTPASYTATPFML